MVGGLLRLERALKTYLGGGDMDFGILLLSTLLVTLMALISYRIVLWYNQRRKFHRERDPSRVELQTKARWRLGGGLITVVGLLTMFIEVLVSGVDVVSPLFGSIEVGMIWAILGIGLTLTYAVVKIPNFAHGDIATIGAYTMALTATIWRYPLPLAFLAAAATGALMGLTQHMLVFRPLINRGARLVQIMIASFALSLTLRAIYFIPAAYYNIINYSPVSSYPLTKIDIPFTQITIYDCNGFCRIGDAAITDLFVWLVATIIPLVVLLHLLLTRTLIGKSMRAVADNVELAQITGINVELIRRMTWLLTGALTGIGGAFLALELPPVNPELGWNSLLRVFAAITLGGLTSFYGTIAGGLIVGFGEKWVPIVGANFGLAGPYGTFMVFLIIVVVLLVRPTGLTGLSLPSFLVKGIHRVSSLLRIRSSSKTEEPSSELGRS